MSDNSAEPMAAAPEMRPPDNPAQAVKKQKNSKLFRFLRFVVLIFVVIPLLIELVFLIIRIAPGKVIPDNFIVYARTPNLAALGSKILEHESLPELLTNPALGSLAPVLNSIRSGGVLSKPIVRFVMQGSVSAALVNAPSVNEDQAFIAVWDSAFLAPLLKLLPFAARFARIADLSYVQDGVPHFEYQNGKNALYLGSRRNLLVVSDDKDILFQTLSPESAAYAQEKGIALKQQDLSLLLASKTVTAMLADGNPLLDQAFTQLRFPDLIELGITVEPKQLNISMASPVETDNPSFAALLSNNSLPPSLMNILPDTVQYCTGISSMGLREMLNAVSELQEIGLEDTLQAAERASRTLLGLSLEDLLFSWTADEFAVFGLEGKAIPVFAVKIGDEAKRKAAFDRAFRSIFLKEDTRLMLDGNRIPQIELPGFVDAILKLLKITIPRPYYTVHENWLLVSESPENILAAVTSVRQNKLLAKTPAWQKLSEAGSGTASLSLFYSLNRSLPFFLRGGSAGASLLRMYHQGLMKLSIQNGLITLTLAAEPGSGKGLESVPGYPLTIGGKTGHAVYVIMTAAGSESRLLLSRDAAALALNPADQKIYELRGEDPVWVIPAEGLTMRTMKDSAAWVVSSRGLVTLVNGNMEAMPGFPVITGLKMSSAPAAWNGKVYLFSEETGGKGMIHTVDNTARISKLDAEFDAPILSPPAFLDPGNMALYPKSFLGEIFLCSLDGKPRIPWPVQIPDIAYGSPLLFRTLASRQLNIAIITTAGELLIYNEEGNPLPYFPLSLSGVFYIQPAWDGQYLWIVSEEGILYRIELNGSVMEQRVPDLKVKENGCIMIADVDGDGIPEIFISGDRNALYGYTQNMISIDGFPLSAWGRPAFADLTGDGSMDCAALGMDNKLYRWRFRSSQ